MNIWAPKNKVIVKTDAVTSDLCSDIGEIRKGEILATGEDVNIPIGKKVFFGNQYVSCPIEIEGRIVLSMYEDNINLIWEE